jgi:hypothetical protein
VFEVRYQPAEESSGNRQAAGTRKEAAAGCPAVRTMKVAVSRRKRGNE